MEVRWFSRQSNSSVIYELLGGSWHETFKNAAPVWEAAVGVSALDMTLPMRNNFHTLSLNQQSVKCWVNCPFKLASSVSLTTCGWDLLHQLMQAHSHRCEAPAVLLRQTRIQGNETRQASLPTKRPTKCCGRQPSRLVKHLLVTQSSLFRGSAGKQQSCNALTLAVCEAFHLDAKNTSRCLSL